MDVIGLVLVVQVLAANVPHRAGALAVLPALAQRFTSLGFASMDE